MNPTDLTQLWREECSSVLAVAATSNERRFEITVPARTLDGHLLDLALVREPDGWAVTDLEQTVEQLELRGFNWETENRVSAISDVARAYDVKLEGYALVLRTQDLPTLSDLTRLTQAIAGVTGLMYHDAPVVSSGRIYRTRVTGMLKRFVPQGVYVETRPPVAEDSEGLWKPDIGVHRGPRTSPLQSVIFTVTSVETADHAVGIAGWWMHTYVDLHADRLDIRSDETDVARIGFVSPAFEQRNHHSLGRLRELVNTTFVYDPEMEVTPEGQRALQGELVAAGAIPQSPDLPPGGARRV